MLLVVASSQGFRQDRSVFDCFAQHNFTKHHVTGTLNVVADVLSRRPDDEDTQVAQVIFHRCTPFCASRASRFRLPALAPSLPGWAREPSIFNNTLAASRVELALEAKREIQQGYRNCPELALFGAILYPIIATMSRRATSCYQICQQSQTAVHSYRQSVAYTYDCRTR